MGKFKDLTGQKFGKLTVIKRVEDYVSPKGYKSAQYLCKCECGNPNELIVRASALRSGLTKSCGCYSKENSKTIHKKYNTYDLSGEFGIGYTNKGEPFYFDLEDYDKIKEYCWRINNNGYVITSINDINSPNVLLISRLVMNAPNDKKVDHKYGNLYDNRKEFLRLCSTSENNRNRKDAKGIYWNKAKKKWVAQICVNYKHLYIGAYKNKEEAIKARLEAEVKYFGEFAPQKHLFEQYGIKIDIDMVNEDGSAMIRTARHGYGEDDK